MSGKKHKRRKVVVCIIFIILVIILLLTLIKVPVTKEILVAKKFYFWVANINVSEEKVVREECWERNVNWTYEWLGWSDEPEGYISPIYNLTNLENESNRFEVYFAFFDDSVYPYALYREKDYDSVKDRLPWSAASMYSQKVVYELGPFEEKEIVISTKMPYNSNYWVYADVEVLNKTICNKKIYSNNETRIDNTTQYRIETAEETVFERVPLWKYLLSYLMETR